MPVMIANRSNNFKKNSVMRYLNSTTCFKMFIMLRMKQIMQKSTVFLLFAFIFNLVASAQTQNENSHKKPLIIGVTDEIESLVLKEKRQVNIYLPAGYNIHDSVQYPVIYLLDGGIDEDFLHTVGIVQFYNFSWVNKMPESIVVGIANVDRKRDFTSFTESDSDMVWIKNSGGSQNFILFIEKELRPFIQSNYKTNGNNTIIGQSLGGLLATEILFSKTQLFNNYIIVSPSLWWNNGKLLKQQTTILNETIQTGVKIYIGVGKEGKVPGLEKNIMEKDAAILADKLKLLNNKNIKTYFDYLPQENHASVLHPALMNAFVKIFTSN